MLQIGLSLFPLARADFFPRYRPMSVTWTYAWIVVLPRLGLAKPELRPVV